MRKVTALRIPAEGAAAFHQEKYLFDLLMERLPEHIYFKDRDSRFIRVNRAMAELFSVPDPAALVGKSDFDFFTHEHAQQAYADEQQLIQGQIPIWSKEERETWPDGHETWVLTTKLPLRDPKGNIIGTFGVSRDITAVKAAERADAERAAIVEFLEAAVVSLDLEGNILTWNPGAERMYGYRAAEMIGRDIAALVPDELRARELEILEASRRGECTRHLETVGVTKTGATISVALTTSPIRDTAGAIIGIALVTTDITARKRLQQQLAQAQKLESIGQLAAGIAHEINTPIQYIGDNAKFLDQAFRELAPFIDSHVRIENALRQSPHPELAEELAKVVVEADIDYLRDEVPRAIAQLSEGVEQVARIVRAMKEFSHPGAPEKTPVDLNHAIESTILVSRNEWKYVAEVTTDFDPDLPLVPCVAGEINQVVLNLIANAAHAIADVVKDSRQKGAIHISTHRGAAWAEVRVRDTGTGIPEGIQSKVFDPFFTTKQVGKGTGQGLSIAHSVIVQNHRGRLSFDTQCGAGTTFLIQLPLEQAETS